MISDAFDVPLLQQWIGKVAISRDLTEPPTGANAIRIKTTAMQLRERRVVGLPRSF